MDTAFYSAYDENALLDGLEAYDPLVTNGAFFPLDDTTGKGIGSLDLDELLDAFDGSSPASDLTGVVDVPIETTPATSDSWGGHSGQKGSCDNGAGHADTFATVDDKSSDDFKGEEERRQARMRKNRENAHLSRLRKKQQLENLQQSCKDLARKNTELNVFVQRLAAENFLLRDHMREVCEQSKVEVPDVPSVLDELIVQGKEASNEERIAVSVADTEATEIRTVPATRTVAGCGAASTVTAPSTTTLPPKMTSTVASCGSTHGPSSKRRKRASSGAAAAFLALFSIFLFVSPGSIVSPGERLYLPDGQGEGSGLVGSSGRSLMALDKVSSPETGEIVEDLSRYFNQAVDQLLLEQAQLELPKQALSVVEDMAQHALALDVDKVQPSDVESADSNDSSKYLPASTVFPALADRYFESSGLEAPQMCRKVFEFSAKDVPSASLNGKKIIENYVLGTMHGFKGRSSGLQLPTNGHDGEVEHVETLKTIDTDNHLPTVQSMEPGLVSVLLPANASSNPSRSGITAINELYVVILNPQNTFSTYSCLLPKRALVL
jgi:hypothetical protein